VAARAHLDEATRASAWASGWGMTLEQVIQYALETGVNEWDNESTNCLVITRRSPVSLWLNRIATTPVIHPLIRCRFVDTL